MLSKTKIVCPKTFPFAHAPSVLFKSFWKRVKMIMMLSENKSNRVLHSFFRNISGVVTLHSEEKPDAFNVKFRKSSGMQGLLGIAPHYSLTLCLTIPPLFHFTLCILAPSSVSNSLTGSEMCWANWPEGLYTGYSLCRESSFAKCVYGYLSHSL